jgi:hypothetical protein
VVTEDVKNPFSDIPLQGIIAEWLKRRLQDTPDLLWLYKEIDKAELLSSTSEKLSKEEVSKESDEVDKVQLPIPTLTAFELDILLPQQGPLWQMVMAKLPMDAWLLQREAVDEEIFLWDFSQVCVLLALYPQETLPEP